MLASLGGSSPCDVDEAAADVQRVGEGLFRSTHTLGCEARSSLCFAPTRTPSTLVHRSLSRQDRTLARSMTRAPSRNFHKFDRSSTCFGNDSCFNIQHRSGTVEGFETTRALINDVSGRRDSYFLTNFDWLPGRPLAMEPL